MISVYTAGGQILKVRLLTLFLLILGLAAFWWGLDLARHYGLAEADGGVLAPLAVRLTWAFVVWFFGVGPAIGMLIYETCYVAQIDFDPVQRLFQFTTLHRIGSRRVDLDASAAIGANYHAGQNTITGAIPGVVQVNAPWLAIRVPKRRLSLIIDLQGEILDQQLFQVLIAPPKRQRGRAGRV